MRRSLCVLLCIVSLAAIPSADVWDVAGDSDDGAGTDNELIHGSNQIHDLGVRPGPLADQDWYVIGQKRQSSYEIVVDGTSGDIGFNTNLLQRVTSTGALLQNSVSTSPGLDYSHSLRWANTTAASINTEFIRVGPGSCGTSCDGADVYHIRAVETTISIARFNNSGSQITVLMTQNMTDTPITATFFYWSAAGTLLQTGSLPSHPAKALNVFNTSGFPALAGQGGSITVAHDGPYGGLNIKAVALEPSTGFSFDTAGVYRGN